MEYGTIERQFHVDASPEIVFDVISSPEHIREWWHAEADVAPESGFRGELAFGDETTPRAHVVPLTVVDAEPPRLFSFRWAYSDGEIAEPGNSLLVTFVLTPAGGGTVVRLTEAGFREMGWEAAVLEAAYQDHIIGWDTHLGTMREYLARLVATP